MATSSDDTITGLEPVRFVVAPGATLFQLVDGPGGAGRNSLTFKYVSGGSLEIINAAYGQTLTAGAGVTLQGTGYLMGATEVLNFNGAPRFYIMATGTTATAHAIFGKSSGN